MFESEADRRWKDKVEDALGKLADCLCQLKDIEGERLKVEQDILAELKSMNGPGPAVRGVVKLGVPVAQ